MASPDSILCVLCKKPLVTAELIDAKMMDGGLAHSDCYYQSLGAEIDQHPIGRPGRY